MAPGESRQGSHGAHLAARCAAGRSPPALHNCLDDPIDRGPNQRPLPSMPNAAQTIMHVCECAQCCCNLRGMGWRTGAARPCCCRQPPPPPALRPEQHNLRVADCSAHPGFRAVTLAVRTQSGLACAPAAASLAWHGTCRAVITGLSRLCTMHVQQRALLSIQQDAHCACRRLLPALCPLQLTRGLRAQGCPVLLCHAAELTVSKCLQADRSPPYSDGEVGCRLCTRRSSARFVRVLSALHSAE